jgi:type I restriction enzyme S subunit
VKEGWIELPLDVVAEVIYGTRVVKKKHEGTSYPVYGGGGATFKVDSFNRENCMILSRFGMSEECVRWVDGKFFLNDSGLSVHPRNKSVLCQRFLDVQLFGRQLEIYALGRGTAQKNLDLPAFRLMPLVVPPLEEQQRIVAILDEAFEGLARARANAEANLQDARDLFQHVTAMRTNSEEFPRVPLSEICDVRDGTHDTPKYVEHGVPLVTQKNIRPEGLNLENVKLISREDHLAIHKRSNVAKGDILISMIGANRGMSCLVDSDDVFSIKNVGLIKATDRMNMGFLLFYLQSAAAEKYVAEATNGGAQPFVGLGKLRAFPTPVPERPLQDKIAYELVGLRETAAVLKRRYQLMLQDLAELRQSILQKAFAGELT